MGVWEEGWFAIWPQALLAQLEPNACGFIAAESNQHLADTLISY